MQLISDPVIAFAFRVKEPYSVRFSQANSENGRYLYLKDIYHFYVVDKI